MHWRRKWQPTPVFLPGESQGRGSLVGCRLWGRAESDTTEVWSLERARGIALQAMQEKKALISRCRGCGVGRASRDSAGFGVMEEGLTSRGGRHPSPGDLPDPGIKARTPALQVDSLPSEPPGKPMASVTAPPSERDSDPSRDCPWQVRGGSPRSGCPLRL